MAVFRIERTKDYTVMSNHHLRNHELSLKAKGLLSMMLSLPDDWNYTTRGLAKICKEGVDAIGSALRELETAGYIVRNQLRDQQGRISDTEYVIYEKPQPRQPETPRPDTAVPDTASPDTENPYLDTPYTDEPYTEKPAQLNKDRRNKEKEIPDLEVLFDLADLFKVFGDSTRIRIMFAISDNEMSVLSIAEALNMEQSTISHQLRVLRQNKLVRVRREGKQIYYTLDDDHVKKIIEMGLDHVLE